MRNRRPRVVRILELCPDPHHNSRGIGAVKFSKKTEVPRLKLSGMIQMLAPPELSAFVTDPEVEAYAKRFRAAWRSSVESIIESGQVLVEAKQALGYGR